MRGIFAGLSSYSDIYFNSMYTKVYYIPLDSQKKELSELMSYIKMCKEITKRRGHDLENWFFNFYFLN